MKLPIGQQARAVNGIQERGGHLYFGFDLGDSATGTTLRKYYSYAELRAVPGNLDELCEVVATYDWARTTKEFIQSDLHAYWTERSLYEAELCSQIKAALQEPPPMVIFPMPDMFPRDVFLAAATYLAHIEAAKVDPVAAKKSAKQLVSAEKKLQAAMRRAVADGQLPEREAA